MPGRSLSAASGYRYGFNGKENDNEIKGDGNQQDYGMRIHDPRLGRFLSCDPVTEFYPELSPYQFASNSPIEFIDLDGLEKAQKAKQVGDPFVMDDDPVMDVLGTAGKVTRGVLKSTVAVFGKTTQFIDDVNLANVKRTPEEKARFEARARANAKSLLTDIAIGYGVGQVLRVATGIFGTALEGEVFSSIAGNTTKRVLNQVASLAKSFKNGKFDIVEAQEDLTVYRVTSKGNNGSVGEFYTTTKPASSAEAESLLNVNKWGNKAEEVTPFVIKKGSQFATGQVEGGTGTQIFIPKEVQNTGGNQIIQSGNTETLPPN